MIVFNSAEFFLQRSDFDLNFSLYFRDKTPDGAFIAKPVIMQKQEGPITPEPMLRLSDGDLTKLMDQMWIAGIRPSKRIVEPQNIDHMNGEIAWLRGVADHLMKRK